MINQALTPGPGIRPSVMGLPFYLEMEEMANNDSLAEWCIESAVWSLSILSKIFSKASSVKCPKAATLCRPLENAR